MARLTMSPIVAAAHGRVADAVLAVNQTRQYVRSVRGHRDRKSPAQLAVRAAFARLGVQWRTLPAELLAAQERAAAVLRISAWDWWVANNVSDERTYATHNLTPPEQDLPAVSIYYLVSGPGYANMHLQIRCPAATAATRWVGYIRKCAGPVDPPTTPWVQVWAPTQTVDEDNHSSGFLTPGNCLWHVAIATTTLLDGVRYFGPWDHRTAVYCSSS